MILYNNHGFLSSCLSAFIFLAFVAHPYYIASEVSYMALHNSVYKLTYFLIINNI